MFIISGVMLGGLIFSAIIARRMISGIEVHRELPRRTWQNEILYFGYFLHNLRRSSSLGISLREIKPRGVEDTCGYCVHLPGRGRFRSGSRLAAVRRGRIRLREIGIFTRFPFGFIEGRRQIYQSSELTVWPAKGKLAVDLLRHGATASTTAKPGRQQGGQDEFFGLRDYRPGDGMRWIHWRRSAGREKPVVREMAHPLPEVLFLILDVRREGLDELAEQQRERMFRFAATLIDHGLGRGYKVGLAMAAAEGNVCVIPPATGIGARCDLLDELAKVDDPQIGLEHVISEIPLNFLSDASTILACPDTGKINPLQLTKLAGQCRTLITLGHLELGSRFIDNPHVAKGGL